MRSLLVGYFWFWERPEIDGTIRIAEWVEVEKAYSLPILNPQTWSKMRSWRSAGKRDGIAVMGDVDASDMTRLLGEIRSTLA